MGAKSYIFGGMKTMWMVVMFDLPVDTKAQEKKRMILESELKKMDLR